MSSLITHSHGSFPPPQERVRSLIDTRKMLIDDNWAPGDIRGVTKKRGDGEDETNAMVEKERVRLEVLKRRQEKELQQVGRKARGFGVDSVVRYRLCIMI